MLYFIVPFNEGQELNYAEHYHGTLAGAIVRAKVLQKHLKKALVQGLIMVEVQNQENDTLQTVR